MARTPTNLPTPRIIITHLNKNRWDSTSQPNSKVHLIPDSLWDRISRTWTGVSRFCLKFGKYFVRRRVRWTGRRLRNSERKMIFSIIRNKSCRVLSQNSNRVGSSLGLLRNLWKRGSRPRLQSRRNVGRLSYKARIWSELRRLEVVKLWRIWSLRSSIWKDKCTFMIIYGKIYRE